MSAPVSEGAAQAYAHCETLVRTQDPDRYYATLFAPVAHRPALFALYAFAQEIARVRDAVSSPLPGEIRLQWWRDALANEARGDVLANPVAAALDDAIARYRLPRAALSSLIDARVFDLYDDPMPSVGDLEGYLGETSSILVRLASMILADGGELGPADAAGHAGVAYGIVGLLRALPWHARRGQLYIPRDMLERNGVTRDDVVLGRGGPGFVAALADMRALARSHFAAADALRSSVPAAVRSSYLVLALARGDLRAMERPGYDPFRTVVARPAWRTIATLWLASLKARVT